VILLWSSVRSISAGMQCKVKSGKWAMCYLSYSHQISVVFAYSEHLTISLQDCKSLTPNPDSFDSMNRAVLRAQRRLH
jgi:hypothetical protein